MTIAAVIITLCDPLNAGFGYQIKVQNDRGGILLFANRDPATGAELLTLADALRVAHSYEPERAGAAS